MRDVNICASRLLGFTLQIFLERFRGIAGAIFFVNDLPKQGISSEIRVILELLFE
jgi:hypothetical protein